MSHRSIRRLGSSSGIALGLVWLFAVLATVGSLAPATWLAGAALACYVATQSPRLPRMALGVLCGAVLASAVAMARIETLLPAIERALGAACFFVAVLLSGGFLREAAEGSTMVRRAGEALISQPPARRNAALSFGGFFMGFVLSFGALQLLGAMVRQANTLATAGGDPRVVAVRQRRSMLAVLRGFCMATACNPISIVAALAITHAPGTRLHELIPLMFAVALALLTLGAALDWLGGPRVTPGNARGSARDSYSLAPVGALVGFVLSVFAAVFGVAAASDLRVIHAVMVTVPAIAIGWMWLQASWRTRPVLLRLAELMRVRYPAQRVEVTILASAGFAGTLIASALPVDDMARLFGGLAIPPWALALIVFWFVVLGAQAALNPILTVTVAGAVLPAPLALGAPPLAVAAAYMAAWGVGTAASPFTLSVLITAGLADQDSRTVAWRWNRTFSVLATAAVSGLLVALSLTLVP